MLPNRPAYGSTIPTQQRHRHRVDTLGEVCPDPCIDTLKEDLRFFTFTGNTEALHDTLAALNPEWSWSKARRYARKLINQSGERRARAMAYAQVNAAPSDRFEGRHPEGVQPRDLTGNRAAHNLDTLAGGGARV